MTHPNVRSAVAWALAVAGLLVGRSDWPASAQGQPVPRPTIQRPGAEATPPLPEEDLKKIDQAKSADDLTALAKSFVEERKLDAAAKTVEKLVLRDPKLLEDAAKQTPKVWNDFWFSCRAKLREKKLAAKDAAGRAKIAEWLNDAGLTAPARTMLSAGLAINKSDPAVRQLAEKWNVAVTGPIRFDLTLGLKEPLIAATVQDEGQAITPRGKGRVFLILPAAYNTGGQRLMINKGDFKPTGEDGKALTITGLAVLERSDAYGAGMPSAVVPADRAPVPELRMPASTEPLWEQIQLQPAERDKPQESVLSNLIHPFIRPVPGQKDQPAPPPAANGPSKINRPATGYFAVIIEVPETIATVNCAYKTDPPIQLDVEFLNVLSKPIEKLQAADREKIRATLASQALNKSVPVATAALCKLNAMRLAIGKGQGQGQGSGDQYIKTSPTVKKVEETLVAAVGHEDPQVRRNAFDLLRADVSEDFGKLVSETTDANVLSNMLTETRMFLDDMCEAKKAAEAASEGITDSTQTPLPQPAMPFPGGPPGFRPASQQPASPNPTGETTATGLPSLSIGTGVAAILAGCLNSKQPVVRGQALDICLAVPFHDTVSLLGFANDDSIRELLPRVAKIEDDKLKNAVFRTLLRRPENKLVSEILATFADTPVVIERENDPIMDLIGREQPAEIQKRLLELLAKADLSAVSGSESLKRLVEKYASPDVKLDAAGRAALLKLALAKMSNAFYEAPVKRANQSNMPGQSQGNVGFETLLASVAAGANTDAQTARQAAAKLLSLGQARALNDRLEQQLQGEALNARVQDFIQNLARDKNLWTREALPVFLGMQLASTEPRTQQLALAAMSAIQKGVDPKQRWRVNLAIKQAIDAKQLATLSLNSDEKISGPAVSLIRDLGAMTAAEAAEFGAAPDEASRQERLSAFEQSRSAKAVGEFACMVYLDLRLNPTSGGPSPMPGRSMPGATGPDQRIGVPLRSAQVTFTRAAQGGQVRIVCDGVQVGPPEAKRDPQGLPGMAPPPGPQPSSPDSIQINAAALLRKALESPDAQKEGLADKVDTSVLRTPQICELKYEQLGAWGAELAIQDMSGGTSSELPFKIVAARILVEPTTR